MNILVDNNRDKNGKFIYFLIVETEKDILKTIGSSNKIEMLEEKINGIDNERRSVLKKNEFYNVGTKVPPATDDPDVHETIKNQNGSTAKRVL